MGWLSVKVTLAQMVPKDFQWSQDVLTKVQDFIDCADRVAIQVSALSNKPYIWVGEVFFYLDLDYLPPPLVRTHRIRASKVLGKPPKISVKEMLNIVKTRYEET